MKGDVNRPSPVGGGEHEYAVGNFVALKLVKKFALKLLHPCVLIGDGVALLRLLKWKFKCEGVKATRT